MRLLNKIKSLIFLLFFCHSILSQNYAFEDQSFLNKKHDLKWGLKKLNEGTILYENGRKEFDDFKRTYVGLNKYFEWINQIPLSASSLKNYHPFITQKY